MKAKWLIGLLVLLTSWTKQEEQDVRLHVGYHDCYNATGDTPITLELKKDVYRKAEPILSATGIALRLSDEPAPDGGDRVYLAYKGRVPGESKNVTITVGLRDRETGKTSTLFTKTFTSCGNN